MVSNRAERRVCALPVLWAGWVLGPTAWGVHLMGSYLLVEWVCRSGSYASLHGLSLATFLVALAGALLDGRCRRAAMEAKPAGAGEKRARIIAEAGIGISVLSAALIVAEAIPNLILDACL